jgi:DNA-binding response OmpR family regulator
MNSRVKVLIVDDEPAVCFGLEGVLSEEGYSVSSVFSGTEALECIVKETFDVVLSDIKLGDIDGLQVLDAVKSYAPDTVTILLTGHATLESSIQALRKGAHDYLLKPIASEELRCSIQKGLSERQKSLRRQNALRGLEHKIRELYAEEIGLATEQISGPCLQAGDLIVDVERCQVICRSKEIALTPTEFGILSLLMRGQGRVFSCQEIVHEVQGYECEEKEARELLRMHIYRLRRKLEDDPASPRHLVNVRGRGYTFRVQ